jgi:hypothetical protein
MIYAGLVVVAISTGTAARTRPSGRFPAGRSGQQSRALWLDVIAAGVAVAAYSVFFSTPLHMLPWPVAVGMLAHALRWWLLAVLALAPRSALWSLASSSG